MTSVNVTENKYSVSVTEGATTVVTAKAPGPQGIQGLGISAGDKGSLTVAANLIDWTLNDSVVTNAKVSASAAIAGTKISPDFGSQNITTTGNAVFGGNLTVSGTTTTIDSTTLTVEDKNIELGKVGSPTDITADGGGITLLGDTNHTFNWVNATDSWTSSEHIALPDNKKLQLGDSQDLQLYHDSNNSVIDSNTGNLYLQSANNLFIQGANNENIIKYIANGALEIYHDGTKKAETSANGFDLPDNSKLQLGDSQDLRVYYTGSLGVIRNDTGTLYIDSNDFEFRSSNGSSAFQKFIKLDSDANGDGGVVELFHDNVKKLETTSSGINVEGTVTCDDILLANAITHEGQTNTKIEFDGTVIKFNSNGVTKFQVHPAALFVQEGAKLAFIASSGQNPHIRSFGTNNGDLEIGSGTDSMAQFRRNSAVELYFNGTKKFETTSSGITVQGSVTTQDMNMSNLNGTANEVDNTKGSWSIQEGADDLFIINRVSGKKYKFNLTEIS
tara:strand:- start:167 stop:1672 length:1506 start_codon:yes stop_codon:yes gene_type:complete